jgi:hypothetical protein
MSEESPAQPSGHEFRVTLRGIQLPTDTAARIDRALHSVVLQQLAELDVATGYAVRFLPERSGNGSTQGMQIIAESEQR